MQFFLNKKKTVKLINYYSLRGLNKFDCNCTNITIRLTYQNIYGMQQMLQDHKMHKTWHLLYVTT